MIQPILELFTKSGNGLPEDRKPSHSKDNKYLAGQFQTLSRIALGLTIVLIPFRYRFVLQSRPIEPIYKDFTDFLIFGSDLALLLTLLFWGLSLIALPRKLSLGPWILSLPILGLLLTSVTSLVNSHDPELTLYHSIRLLFLAGFYLYLVNEIKSLGEVILPVVFGVVIQATISLGQVLAQRSLGLVSWGELVLDPSWGGVSIVWADGVRSLRAYGLSDHPNILAGCFTFSLILIGAWYLRSSDLWRAPVASVFALGLAGLLVTFSRAAWLALAVSLVLLTVILVRKGDVRIFASWLGLLLAGLVILVPFFLHNATYLGVRLNQGNSFQTTGAESRSLTERTALNRAANELFTGDALTGVGLGAFPQALREASPDFPYDYQPAHLVLSVAAAETGIFGALFYFLVLLSPWLGIVYHRERLKFSVTLLGTSMVLLALSIIGLFDYYTWLLNPGRLWQWMVWGLWGAAYASSLRGDRYD